MCVRECTRYMIEVSEPIVRGFVNISVHRALILDKLHVTSAKLFTKTILISLVYYPVGYVHKYGDCHQRILFAK